MWNMRVILPINTICYHVLLHFQLPASPNSESLPVFSHLLSHHLVVPTSVLGISLIGPVQNGVYNLGIWFPAKRYEIKNINEKITRWNLLFLNFSRPSFFKTLCKICKALYTCWLNIMACVNDFAEYFVI